MNINDRVSKLEAIADPPALPPLVLYLRGRSEADCARFNERAGKGKGMPMPFIVRPGIEAEAPGGEK